MKDLVHYFSLPIIILFVFILAACQQEEFPVLVPHETKSQSNTENVRCGLIIQKVIIENAGIKWIQTITVPCFTLTIDPKIILKAKNWSKYLEATPNFKNRITNPNEVVMFPVNEQLIGIQYFVTTPSRGKHYFVLPQAITLTPDLQRSFKTNRTFISPGRYHSMYDKERNLYVTFLPIRQ